MWRCVLVAWLAAGCDEVFDLTTVKLIDAPDAPVCPAAYATTLQSTSSLYRFVATNTTWPSAAADCSDDAEGATHLVVVDTDQERADIVAVSASDLWIGLSDRVAEGTFLWVTDQGPGLPSSGAPWSPTQPDDQLGEQDCVRIIGATSSGTPTLYDDVGCESMLRDFVCECDGVAQDPTRL